MSTLVYAGIELEVLRTRRFVKRPVLDEDGKFLCSHYVIEVECVSPPLLPLIDESPTDG